MAMNICILKKKLQWILFNDEFSLGILCPSESSPDDRVVFVLQPGEEATHEVHRSLAGSRVAPDAGLHEHTSRTARLEDARGDGVGLRPLQAERLPRGGAH